MQARKKAWDKKARRVLKRGLNESLFSGRRPPRARDEAKGQAVGPGVGSQLVTVGVWWLAAQKPMKSKAGGKEPYLYFWIKT